MEMKWTENIKIKNGLVRGEYIDGSIATFKGIPYAAPPIGDLRFKPTKEHEDWEGVLDCVEFGKSALQNPISFNDLWTEEFIIRQHEMSEDCLTLNIWTDLSKTNMPVIVYMYGGGLVSGGSSCDIYDGKTLAKDGVIYLTFNHREGNLAFFSLNDEEKEKHYNNLILDEIFVLKWVQENIASFGGDPSNVTLMGQSSGSISANAISASPFAKGLYKRIVAMGYNSYINFGCKYISREENDRRCQKILDVLNIGLKDAKDEEASNFLKAEAINRLTCDGSIVKDNFKNEVDNGETGDEIFVMGAVPGDNLAQGICAEEIIQKRPPVQDKEKLLELCKTFFGEKYDEFCNLYDVENKEFKELKKEIDNDFTVIGLLDFKNARVKAGGKNTYLYYFTHVLPGPMSKVYGAFHSCEVPYFFNHLDDFRKDYWQKEDYELASWLCRDLAKFVKNDETSLLEALPQDEYSYFEITADKKEVKSVSKEKYELFTYAFENTK